MAATYPTISEEERTQRTTSNLTGSRPQASLEPVVGIYERPEPRSNIAGAVLLMLALLIVAYFVMQWVF